MKYFRNATDGSDGVSPRQASTFVVRQPGTGHSTVVIRQPGRTFDGRHPTALAGHSTVVVRQPGTGHSTVVVRQPGQDIRRSSSDSPDRTFDGRRPTAQRPSVCRMSNVECHRGVESSFVESHRAVGCRMSNVAAEVGGPSPVECRMSPPKSAGRRLSTVAAAVRRWSRRGRHRRQA